MQSNKFKKSIHFVLLIIENKLCFKSKSIKKNDNNKLKRSQREENHYMERKIN